MSFESSMSQVAATMGISAEAVRNGSKEMEILEKAAKDAGSTTKYSAKEAADALNYLALAGYDAEQAASTLPTVLNLVAAGGMDLAYASDLVTDSMSALGMETKDVTKFTDQLAKTSQKSNTNVSQLGEAILTVGGTAKTLAGGTVELNTQLGILADNGIKGAEGGTALRNIILSLSAPTDKAAKLMKELGLNAYDMNGNLRPTNEIFTDLNGILSTMSQEGRTEVLNTLFNKVDLKSANALLANSGERFNTLSKEIANSQGAAEGMATTMGDNLQGAITTLKSALEGAGIAIYNTFGETAKEFVNTFATGVRNITQAFNEGKLDNVLALIGAGLAGIISYLAIMKGYAIAMAVISIVKTLVAAAGMIKSVSGAMAILNAVMMANPIGLVIALIAGLIAMFVYLWNTSEGFRNFWIQAWEMIKNTFTAVCQSIAGLFNGIIDLFKNLWSKLVWLKDMWLENWQQILFFLATFPVQIAKIFAQIVASAIKWVADMGAKGLAAGKELFNNFWNAIKSLPQKALELGKNIPSMLWNGIKNAGAWLKNSVMGWVKGLFSFNLFTLGPDGGDFDGLGASVASYGGLGNLNARGMTSTNYGSFRSNTNVSLNIGGREFDKLVVKTVSDNYGKIESIVQQKRRGRR